MDYAKVDKNELIGDPIVKRLLEVAEAHPMWNMQEMAERVFDDEGRKVLDAYRVRIILSRLGLSSQSQRVSNFALFRELLVGKFVERQEGKDNPKGESEGLAKKIVSDNLDAESVSPIGDEAGNVKDDKSELSLQEARLKYAEMLERKYGGGRKVVVKKKEIVVKKEQVIQEKVKKEKSSGRVNLSAVLKSFSNGDDIGSKAPSRYNVERGFGGANFRSRKEVNESYVKKVDYISLQDRLIRLFSFARGLRLFYKSPLALVGLLLIAVLIYWLIAGDLYSSKSFDGKDMSLPVEVDGSSEK